MKQNLVLCIFILYVCFVWFHFFLIFMGEINFAKLRNVIIWFCFWYVEQVLTHRLGTPVMLSLIYSEILKMLRLWGLLDFDCELFFPHDLHGLPRGYNKQKSKESDQPHIMTSENLLVEVSGDLQIYCMQFYGLPKYIWHFTQSL